MFLELLSSPLWQSVTLALLHFVWQGALVALVLMIGLAFVRAAPRRYLLACLALAVLVVCPIVTAMLVQPVVQTSFSNEAITNTAYFSAADVPAASRSWHEWLAATVIVWQPYLILCWLSGVLALSGRLLVSYLGVRALRRSAEPIRDSRLLVTMERLAGRLGLHSRVRVSASRLVRDALVVGLWRPLVLVPAAWLTEMQPAALEAVLAHELAHVRRHDLWINLLQRVVETLLFYHPAVWYVSRVLRVEREKCCDLLAVSATGEKVVYVEALEWVARRRMAASPSVWAAAMGGTRTMNLLERVRNVLGLRPTASVSRYWPVGVAALALPLGLWCLAFALPAAQAQDEERDRPAAERERDDDGRERPDARRDREDAPRERGPRDGDRPGFRPREGDRPFPPREGDRPAGPPPGDLMRVIAELRMEVMQLRREVNELRGHGPRPAPPGEPGFHRPDGERRPLADEHEAILRLRREVEERMQELRRREAAIKERQQHERGEGVKLPPEKGGSEKRDLEKHPEKPVVKKGEPDKHEPKKGEPDKHETKKGEPDKHEPKKGEPDKHEPKKGEQDKHEVKKDPPKKE